MVIKLQSFDKGGKPEGPAFIMWDDEVRFARVTGEANGGFTIHMEQADEFGNETKVALTFDKTDVDQLKQWTT